MIFPASLNLPPAFHPDETLRFLFIQFTANDPRDAPIPDEAGASDSTMTFGVLKAAQAMGDRQALLNVERRVICFHLGDDVVGGLKQLTEALA